MILLLIDRMRRLLDWSRPSLPDLGTVSLGVAAILLARAMPSSNLTEVDVRVVLLSLAFGLVGLYLRRVGNSGVR